MSEAIQRLARVSRGFRERYLDYATLTEQLEAWAREFPELMKLESLGRTPEGRELWLCSVGPEPARARPAVWVNANLHAAELCGSNVALALVEDLLRLHLTPDTGAEFVPSEVARVAREVLFYVMPRVSPDGVEVVLTSGRRLRSVPRDTRVPGGAPYWRALDLDGDGLSLSMRYQDPAGEFVESASEPGLMLRRKVEDCGPFYQLCIEGVVENHDGVSLPPVGPFDDHFPDLNRNFPWGWAPEPEQVGAGAFPTSEPESRAIVEFATRHTNIFAWADLHTFGGVFIRPLGHAPDTAMNTNDLGLYQQLEAWALQHTGYPTVSGFEEFTYRPGQALCGDLVDYAYHQRGAFAYTVELWDLFRQLGVPKPVRFVDYYVRLGDLERQAFWRWDREHNQARVFRPWREVEHPQLGRVEVGGFDPRVGVWNPPEQYLPEVCRGQSQVLLRVAALAPRLRLRAQNYKVLGPDTWQVTLVVENIGYLPSYVLDSANKGPLGARLRVEFLEEGAGLVSPAKRLELGHLAGWGGGLYGSANSLLSPAAPGSAARAQVTLIARGRGAICARVSSPRLGTQEIELRLPEPDT